MMSVRSIAAFVLAMQTSLAPVTALDQVTLPIQQISTDEAVEVVPFQTHRAKKAILVVVQINDERVQMLVDTGATSTIVSARAMGWKPGRLKKAEFSRQGPGIMAQGTWESADVRLGETMWKNRLIVVMDFREVRQVFGRGVAGILGQDILTEFASVEFDFDHQEIRLRGH